MFSIGKAEKQQDKGKYDRIHVVKGDVVADELAELIANPPEGSIKTQITPKMAAEMLKYNTKNRPVSAGAVSHYATQMIQGKWHYTRVPIIFSNAGRLIDGQHRLNACVAANTPIWSDVAFGAPDESFAFIDNQKSRTAGDVFAINGVKDQNVIAAISKVVHQYCSGLTIGDGGSNKRVTNAEMYEFFCDNRDITEAVPAYRMFAKSRLANPSLMAGLYVICARKSRAQADHFFSVAAEGFGAQKKTEPAMVLHKKFIEVATSGDKMGRKVQFALTVDAWNRMRAGLSGRGMNYNPEAKAQRVR